MTLIDLSISLILRVDLIIFSYLFFFLMIRRPPRSTLFPTRRSSDLLPFFAHRGAGAFCHIPRDEPAAVDARSEEHTSELQSHSDLVCRLLLEKKKSITSCASPSTC